MKFTHAFLALALLGCAGLAQAADNCSISLKANDAMQYDLKTATVSAGCATITIELAHTGKLPVTTMGHNVVIAKTADIAAIDSAGIKAGAASHYVAKGDARVIASSTLVGGGQKTRITLPGKKLTAGGDYSFFCSFPGHSTMMKGKLVVTK